MDRGNPRHDANVKLLYHGTGVRRPRDVVEASEGLDPRHAKASGNFYGAATYLSEDPSYGLGTGPYAHRMVSEWQAKRRRFIRDYD